jgi:hypothetical protein
MRLIFLPHERDHDGADIAGQIDMAFVHAPEHETGKVNPNDHALRRPPYGFMDWADWARSTPRLPFDDRIFAGR